MLENTTQTTRPRAHWQMRWWLWLPLAVVIGAAGLWGADLWALARNEQALEAFIADLGWFGPIVLIAANVAQILIAPIPGYLMQAAAGYLYGPVWGGLWGTIGLLLGSMGAMALARIYGRPLVIRLTGAQRLDRWERLTYSTSTIVWFLILLAPTGDLPYFMAGLARVSFGQIFVLTLLIRVPTVFVVASAGAGTWLLSGWHVAAIIVGLAILMVVTLRYQYRLNEFVDRHVQRRLFSQKSP